MGGFKSQHQGRMGGNLTYLEFISRHGTRFSHTRSLQAVNLFCKRFLCLKGLLVSTERVEGRTKVSRTMAGQLAQQCERRAFISPLGLGAHPPVKLFMLTLYFPSVP
jgi:hypothetical protein